MVANTGERKAEGSELIAVGGLYCLAHAWLLGLGGAVFWDDWVLVSLVPSSLLEMFTQQGSPWIGVMHNALLGSPFGVAGYHVLTFALHLATGVFLYRILASVDGLGRYDRRIITALFLVAPFFWSRVSLITFTYTLALFLFFAGWRVFAGQIRPQPAKSALLLAGVLFAASFFLMPSLLVFFAVPGVHFLWQNREAFPRFYERRYWIYLPLLGLPILVWVIKTGLLTPYGMYLTYNDFRPELGYWHNVPMQMLRKFLAMKVPLWPLLVALPVAWVATRMPRDRDDPAAHRDAFATSLRVAAFVVVGLVITYLGAFPYLIVGKVPTFVDWTSRHQVLLPLGTAVVSWALGRALPNIARRFWYAGVLAIFIAINLASYVDVARDVVKQDGILHQLARNERIAQHRTFPVDERTRKYNAWQRTYRPYEWIGMFNRVFPDDGLRYAELIRSSSQAEWLERREDISRALIGLGMLRPLDGTSPDCVIRVEAGDYDLKPVTHVIRAWVLRIASRSTYQADIVPRVIALDCVDIDETTWDE